MSSAISKIEMGARVSEQRRIADEYRAVEKVVQRLRKALATTSVDTVGRAETEASIVSRTADLMRLGQQMLELDASVTIASLRPA